MKSRLIIEMIDLALKEENKDFLKDLDRYITKISEESNPFINEDEVEYIKNYLFSKRFSQLNLT